MRHALRNAVSGVLLAGLLGLSACDLPPTPADAPEMGLRAVSYDSLVGWQQDDLAGVVMPALLQQCRRLSLLPLDAALGGAGMAQSAGGKAADWTPFCHALQWVRPGDDAAAHSVIAAWLQPYEVSERGSAQARFTGYFEPEFAGSLARDAAHTVPVYRRPPDLPTARGSSAYWTRAQIDQGALAGRSLEIAWLSDPVDLFFLQLQGSGRVRLPSGQIIRLGYDGRNGAPYVPLGRVLVEQGALAPDAVSMQQVRLWLEGHPGQARAMMERDPNYVFFRSVDDLRPDQGPVGALGVDLRPLRSIAIDRAFLPLSAPVWIDATEPDGTPLRRLMLAQDLGTDITGPTRADIFIGWGSGAARLAGGMHSGGRLVVLLPRPPAPAATLQQPPAPAASLQQPPVSSQQPQAGS